MLVVGTREQLENYIRNNGLNEDDPGTLNYHMYESFSAPHFDDLLFIIKVDDNLTTFEHYSETRDFEFDDEEERQRLMSEDPEGRIIDLRVQQGGVSRKRRRRSRRRTKSPKSKGRKRKSIRKTKRRSRKNSSTRRFRKTKGHKQSRKRTRRMKYKK